jgi:hypothetical protein
VGEPRDPHNFFGVSVGGGPGPKPDPKRGGGLGFMKPISSRDPRTVYIADVPLNVALVRVTFRSGPPLAVRPLRVDQARARATGTPYPYSFVAVAYDSADEPRTITYEDAGGNDVTPPRGMVYPHGKSPGARNAPVVQSPAL